MRSISDDPIHVPSASPMARLCVCVCVCRLLSVCRSAGTHDECLGDSHPGFLRPQTRTDDTTHEEPHASANRIICGTWSWSLSSGATGWSTVRCQRRTRYLCSSVTCVRTMTSSCDVYNSGKCPYLVDDSSDRCRYADEVKRSPKWIKRS